MRVETFLEDSTARSPGKVALIVGDGRITYAEIDERANRVAHALRERGVRRDDRVVIFLENSAEAVVGIFGTLKAGAVFSVINAMTKADKLAYILNNCRAAAVITHDRLLATAAPAIDRAPLVVATLVVGAAGAPAVRGGAPYRAALDAAPPDPPAREGIDIDLAMIIYTSGSTGSPKGVMMTHRNIDAAATSITTYLENSADDIILSALPLSFDYGLYQVLMAFKVGASVVLENSFAFPYAILRKMAAECATGFPLVPTMAAMLLQMKDLAPGSLPDLRYITNTAAALPPAHIRRLQELFPTARVYSMYGLTECKRCTYLPPEQLAIRPESVGKAIPGTEAYVVNERGEPVQPGEVGVLVIRGAHVMKGYWEDPQATDRMLRPGRYPWEKVLYTGDLFKVDEEGYLYFVGRSDDIIKTRGEKVSPKEVENVLYALPGVWEAAVIGVPDPSLGMAIKAVIVPVEEGCLTERDVVAHCARHLENFMVPKYVEFRAELPKTTTGKIRRREVQQEVLEAEVASGDRRP
ncbi:MAG: AMP-binding protein [Planctomycetaceae bacterium]|nr:AMP-binding protein [Planctomycetaceae bacterium]